jgi:starch-binding outer membrane protein, SusD/RagB family
MLLLLSGILSCKKEFLDKKPDSDLQIPSTLADFRLLLDNERIINETPVLGELSSDNFYLPQTFWAGLNAKEKNGYVWAKDVYAGTIGIADWDRPYQQVYYSNVVIEGLNKLNKSGVNLIEWNDLMGAALFIRANAFHHLLQIFSPVYDEDIVDAMGIPLRLASDISIPSTMATLKQSYDQVISDLRKSIPLFEKNIQTQYYNRPSKTAAYALLARVYLSMSDYGKALELADSTLLLHSALLDYAPPTNGFSNNPEMLYQSRMFTSTSLSALGVPCYVDSTLFNSYHINDRRRTLYFNTLTGTPRPQVGYSLNIFMFTGLATDEVYLIKAESLARTGNYNDGINVLNSLLSNRFADSDFTPVTAINQQEALDTILVERRKELVFRGIRWTDLKRLNKDGANITLKRKLGSTEYILTPNHPNYILPLPSDVSRAPNSRTDIP